MAGRVSEFTRVVQNIASEADLLRERAAKSKTIPLMHEKLSAREARTRVAHMTPQNLAAMTPKERSTLLKAVGTDAVVGVFRRGR